MKPSRNPLQGWAERADAFLDGLRLNPRWDWRRRPGDDRPMIVEGYMGFGTTHRLCLAGRVIRDRRFRPASREASAWRNLAEFYKRMASHEVPRARVCARFGSVEQELVTDTEGYFLVDIPLPQAVEAGWHDVQLALLHPASRVRALTQHEARVLVPGTRARLGIISDIDDTVVHSNVARKLRMLLMLARSNVHTRKPFKGVAAFYRALQRGASGLDDNPVFYVSNSPWNLYAPLVEFLRLQDIPLGPLLLRDFGDHTLFGSDRLVHKFTSIERIFNLYPRLSFVLIGDSGEKDPEIYREIVRRHPRRVRAIYIRSVNPEPARIAAVEALIAEVERAGSQLVLTPDSEFAARHAAEQGLIAASALGSVHEEKQQDERAPVLAA